MPVKAENRARYPKDWRAIARAVKERAGWRCEGSPAFPACRAVHGAPHPVTGSRVVLTTAHLDHTPENCAPDNLRALCQRCHLAYDAAHHAATRRMSVALKRHRAERAKQWRAHRARLERARYWLAKFTRAANLYAGVSL